MLMVCDDYMQINELATKLQQTQIILDKSPSLVFLMVPETLQFVFVNASLLTCLDYSQDEMLTMSANQLNPAFSDEYCQSILAPLLSGEQESVDFEMAFIRKNHEIVPVAMFLRLVEMGDSKLLLAIAHDITIKQQHEAHISRLTNFYKALSEVNQAIVRMHDEAALFPLVCRVAVELGGVAMAFIAQVDARQGWIKPVVSYGHGKSSVDGLVIAVTEQTGMLATAFHERRIVVIDNSAVDKLSYLADEDVRTFGWQSAATFPIMRAGEVFALLTVHHQHSYAFESQLVDLISEMCGDISFALDNFDREHQRKLLEDELKQASLVYQYSSQAMMVTDADNQIISVNHAYTTVTGYAAHEVIGKNPSVLSSGRHDAEFYKTIWNTLKAYQYWQGRIWSKRKNGEIYPEWMAINLVLDEEGEPYRYVATFYDITDKVRAEELIWKQANYDLLTELPNRYMLHQRLVQEVSYAQHSGHGVALLYIDLDQFKEVNDTLGHQMGDLLLVEVAQRIRLAVNDNDIVARLGGDEFVVIVPASDDKDYLTDIAQNVITQLAASFDISVDKRVIHISASIGIALCPDDANTADDLLREAEQAMYAAKQAGRNRLSFYTVALQQKAQNRLRLLSDLRYALTTQQFELHFQPIVDLNTGKITKAEALIRWQHPEHGWMSPVEFIPLAEETGLIIALGDWVFKEAATWARRWQQNSADGSSIQVSVNMSPVQFKDATVKLADWLAYLQTLGLSGENLVIEITEGLLLDASTLITDKLLTFRDAGIKVSMDDFGTGYSALSYLKKFDIDYLKIDQSFVRDICIDPSDLALSEAIVVMAHKLGLSVIAEGVETAAQRDLLAQCGCDYAQGYYFSPALPPAEFELFIRDNQATAI
jgi:diguanylate cyclase (GGDEF)-like protein/PAS domain S-box-containing protein